MDLKAVERYIHQKLPRNLSPTLFYHGFHHTLDVVEAAKRIAFAEGVTDVSSLILLETACLYHDLGFIVTYKGHEKEGCHIARLTLPEFGFTSAQVEEVCGMIMATQIPQTPHTLLEKIIADADLDYLGRDDFEPIAHTLYVELREREMVQNVAQWNQIQVNFLDQHHYWTTSMVALRSEAKHQHLQHLKALLKVSV